MNINVREMQAMIATDLERLRGKPDTAEVLGRAMAELQREACAAVDDIIRRQFEARASK